jgi:hypothetical protein
VEGVIVVLFALSLAGVCVGVSVVDGGSVPVAADCVDGVLVSVAVLLVVLAGDDIVGVVVAGVGEVVLGVGEVLLGVGEDVLGVGVAATAMHCQTVGLGLTLAARAPDHVADVASACGAMEAVTTRPAAVVSKMPPALRLMAAGRTRAKHMSALPVLVPRRLPPGLSHPRPAPNSRLMILAHQVAGARSPAKVRDGFPEKFTIGIPRS